jgi:hypothetical protein
MIEGILMILSMGISRTVVSGNGSSKIGDYLSTGDGVTGQQCHNNLIIEMIEFCSNFNIPILF